MSEVILCLNRPDPSRNRQCPRRYDIINSRYFSTLYSSSSNRVYRPNFSKEGVRFFDKRLKKKFDKHAKAFGVEGKYNRENMELFKEKLKDHIQSSTTQSIESTYRKNILATYHFDNDKNLVIIVSATISEFISGWTLA